MSKPLFTKKWDINRELRALIEATKVLPRGSVVSHDDIAGITKFTKDITPWGRVICRWKKAMLHPDCGGFLLESVSGVGYRLVPVAEQITTCVDRRRKQAERRERHAQMILAAIPPEQMTPEQIVYAAERLKQIGEVEQTRKAQNATAIGWLANPQTLPRPVPKKIA